MNQVSIVIPAYNQGRFVAKAVETALGQVGASVEVVVVNDGSTDNTAEVVRAFAGQPNFRYVEQSNQGLPGARNSGIRETSAPYLCFLDADDFYHPDKVRKQLELMEEDPGLGFVYCDILCVDEAGNPMPEQWSVGTAQRKLSGNVFRSLMLGGYFTPHTVMIRRRLLEELGGFDPELGGHADYEMWLRVSGAGHRAYYLDERLAYYRLHGSNMSGDGLRMTESRVATLRKIIQLYPEASADAIETLQQVSRDVLALRAEQNQRYEQILRRATEGGNPPERLRNFFRKLFSRKIRRSLRKRLTYARRCLNDEVHDL